MDFVQLNQKIKGMDPKAVLASKKRWDSIAKPLGSLGILETAIQRIAGLIGTPDIDLSKRAVLVMCADNGVVVEGVTQTGQEVTSIVAGNIAVGKSSVCKMAKVAHADTFGIDIGMLRRMPGVIDKHISSGTDNIAVGPAMTRQQAEEAIAVGMELVRDCKEQGYRILITGEMGIGNTTTSSALASVLLNMPVPQVTGRGAGLSDEKLANKIRIIEQAIAVNAPDPTDPLDVLAKLGGYDIAGMAGVFLGGALYNVPIVIDGLISSVAALVAARLCSKSRDAMLASHRSAEPAACAILQELGLDALLCADMRLGEGTGGVCLLPLLDMALAVYNDMSSFDDIGIEAYTPQGGNIC